MKRKDKRQVRRRRRAGAYTVGALKRMNGGQLAAVAKVLAVDYEGATGQNKEALGTLIQFIKGLVEDKTK